MKPSPVDGLFAVFDVGSYAAKAAVIERTAGKVRLASVEEEPLKPLTEFPSEVEFRDALIQSLRALAGRLPLGRCREVIGLFSHRELQIKLVDLPAQITPEQFDSVLGFEARKLLSPNYRSEPFVYSYRVLRDSPPFTALAVIPQSHLQKTIELYQSAGIRLAGLYPEIFGELAAKEAMPMSGSPVYTMINVGHGSTHMTIFSAGEPRFTRQIPSGVSEIPERVTGNEPEIYTQKIRFSFDYCRAVFKLGQIDEIGFFGGGALKPGFLDFAREYFHPSKVSVIDLSSCMDVSLAMSQRGGDASKLAPFLPGITTYLAHARATPLDRSNIFRQWERKESEERWKNLSHLLPAGVALAGLLVGIVILAVWAMVLQSELDKSAQEAKVGEIDSTRARTKLVQLESQRKPGSSLAPFEQKLLEPLLKDHLAADEILFLVTKSKPAGVTFEKLRVICRTDETGNTQEEEEEPMPANAPGADEGQILPPGASSMPAPTSTMGTEGVDNFELRGQTLEIKGTCIALEDLVSFTSQLRTSGLISRLQLVRSKPAGRNLRFTIRGDLQ